MDFTSPLLIGLATALPLIVPIGPQNAFVLRQGILKVQVLPVVTTTIICDALLIVLGTYGWASTALAHPQLARVITLMGVLFLFLYGIRSFCAAFSGVGHHLHGTSSAISLPQVMLTTISFSLLNPHAYLDTVVLIGSVGARYIGIDRLAFTTGAIFASALWFIFIGVGARFAIPLFNSQFCWRVLDFLIGSMVWIVGISLLC